MKHSTALKTRRLGRTGWQVTELGLGCFQYTSEFGVPRDEAVRVLDCAFEAGINFFDTAPRYGYGESEELLGRALARHGRDRVRIATKVGYVDRMMARHLGEKGYRDEDALMRAIKHSFWLLRLDHVDVFMVHEPDWPQWGMNLRTGDAPVMAVLERLKREGAISAIGIGAYNCPDVVAMLIETGRFDVALVTMSLSLVQQPIRDRVLPAAKRHDVGIIVGGVMSQGGPVAADRIKGGLLAVDRASAQRLIDAPTVIGHQTYGRRLLAAYDLAEETGLGLVELAIRYVLAIPEIHCHIAGARELAHLEANLGYVRKGLLPPEIVARIDAIGKIQ